MSAPPPPWHAGFAARRDQLNAKRAAARAAAASSAAPPAAAAGATAAASSSSAASSSAAGAAAPPRLKPFKLLLVDGGSDENPRFFMQIMCNVIVFLRCEYEVLVMLTSAAGFTPLRLVEFVNCMLSQEVDGAYITSETFGVSDLGEKGEPKTEADAMLEELNLRHAAAEMVAALDGAQAFGFPITTHVPPVPSKLSPFASIDEPALKEYRDAAGGCGCVKTDCSGRQCRSCLTAGRPCTFRCKCRGTCANPTPLPPPENLSATELDGLPLEEIVLKMTPRDVEFFAAKHGVFLHYGFSLKLCSAEDASGRCWYCKRFDALRTRRLPPEFSKHHLPLYTTAKDGEFIGLKERWRMVLAAGKPAATEAEKAAVAAFTSDDSLPSRILHEGYVKHGVSPAPAAMQALVDRSLIDAKDIKAKFKEWHEKEQKAKRFLAPHRRPGTAVNAAAAAAASGERRQGTLDAYVGGGGGGEECAECVDEGVVEVEVEVEEEPLEYDASLVGRRITLTWIPPGEDREAGQDDYYGATIVAYSARSIIRRGDPACRDPAGRRDEWGPMWGVHFDDGLLRERVTLPDAGVEIMNVTVTVCSCATCAKSDAPVQLPVPWASIK